MTSSLITARHTIIPAVHLLLTRSDQILLLRRANTGFFDGAYSVPAGHVETGESATAALIREAAEEVGIGITAADLTPALVMHRRSGDQERVDFFFTAARHTGQIVNLEPGKCDDLRWFAVTGLPQAMVPYVRAAIEAHHAGATYAEFGWAGQPD